MNILVVDDEKEIADVIELYLQNDQYSVYKFYTGQEALDCIGGMKIDLAILDIMLSDADPGKIHVPGNHADSQDRIYGQDHGAYAGSGRLHPQAFQSAGTGSQGKGSAAQVYPVQ